MSFEDRVKNVKGAVPGQAMMDKMGDLPFNQPPVSNKPEEGVQIIFDALTSPSGSRNIINALRNGATVDTIAQSIAKMMHGEGLMAPQAIPLMGPAIMTIIENVAEIAGVPANRLEEEDPWSQPDPQRVAQLVAEMDKTIGNVVDEELEDQAAEGAIKATEGEPEGTPPAQGLMSSPRGQGMSAPRGAGLMARPGGTE